MNDNSIVLDMLIKAPPTQIDPYMVEKLKRLKELPQNYKCGYLKSIMDDCVNGSLCSDFAIMVMEMELKKLIQNDKQA